MAQRADSFFGTDLCYEDVEPKRVEDYEASLLGAGSLGARSCERVEVRAAPSFTSTYERLVNCIEVERGIILWTEFYRRGRLVKRLEVDPASVRRIGARFIPFSMTMRDLERRSETIVTTERYEVRPLIPDSLFSTWNLEVGDADSDRSRSRGASSADASPIR